MTLHIRALASAGRMLPAPVAAAFLAAASCISAPPDPPPPPWSEATLPEESADWSRVWLGSRPAVSPDGSFFLFEWCERIWSAPVAGGTAVALGSGETRDSWPVVSPDGKRAAFISIGEGVRKIVEVPLPSPDGTLASAPRAICSHTEGALPLSYSPDGSNIVATVWRDHASAQDCQRAALISTGATEREEILFDAPAKDPALSPDGETVLFVERGEELYRNRPRSTSSQAGRIWAFHRTTGAFELVVDRPDDSRTPVWAPDGSGFYYVNGAGGCRNIWFRDIATGADRQITFFSNDPVFQPSVSADGKTLVFRQKFDFWRMDPANPARAPQRIVLHPANMSAPAAEGGKRRWYSQAWNNDSSGDLTFYGDASEIAFTSGGDLWTTDTAVPVPRLVHGSSRTHERECAFTPGGEALYYLSDRGDGVDLWVARRANPSLDWQMNTGFKCERLTFDDSYRCGLTISPDGNLVVWCDETGHIHFANLAGRELAVSRVPSSACTGYAVSPDSKYALASFTDGYGNPDIWIIPVLSNIEPIRVTNHHLWDSNPAWSPDGKVVAFTGQRAAGPRIFYAYVNPADEIAETAGDGRDDSGARPDILVQADLKTLPSRLREVEAYAGGLVFSPDSRRLAFTDGNGTSFVRIPARNKPETLSKTSGEFRGWARGANGGSLVWLVDRVPAIGDRKLEFKVHQTTNLADYRELAFLSLWARIRDFYYDANTHGADWNAMRTKYRMAARNAPHRSVLIRVFNMLLAELDSSHLGIMDSETSGREWGAPAPEQPWIPETQHTGLRFDPSHTGEGWLVKDVVPGSPADKTGAFRKGDIVLSVNGEKAGPGVAYASLMTWPRQYEFSIERKRGKANPETIKVRGATFYEIRKLLRKAEMDKAREYVHSRGDFGYIAVDQMDNAGYNAFADAVYSEGMGRSGLVIDVRSNTGGFTADKILSILHGADHSRTSSRGDNPDGYLLSYWGRPVMDSKPVVVLINEKSFSNAEIFAHSMRALGRAKLVGVATGGNVIATTDLPLLDVCTYRNAHKGMFLPDGTDMEHFGAEPHVKAELTPADYAAGRDPQLEKAVDILEKEAANPGTKPPLRFAG